MPCGWIVKIEDGEIKRRWAVEDGGIHKMKGAILVPIDQIDGMSDEQIGRAIRLLIPQARLCFAEEYADHFRFRIGDLTDEEIAEGKSILSEFANKSSLVNETLNELIEWQAVEEIRKIEAKAREESKSNRKRIRSEVSSKYDKLFLAIGRRDGFKCAACGSTEELQIDHIVPVSLNGSNDLSNLQILCRKDNLEKSDEIIDYRSRKE